MPDESSAFIRKQLQFTANLREPERCPMPTDVDPSKMKLYQNLFFNNLHGILTRAFPILAATQGVKRWSEIIRDFSAKHKSKSPTYFEIPEEFLHYLSYVRQRDQDPAWMYELAHYEWIELALDLSPLSLAMVPHNYNGHLLNETPVVSPLAWLQIYQYPVHLISAEQTPAAPGEQPTYLVIYRNWRDKIEFMLINDFTHAMLTLLNQENNELTGREVLESLISLTNHPNPAMVMQGGGLILEELRERHILLGTRHS